MRTHLPARALHESVLTMHVFGLTGGIAVGKSTVAAVFASAGVPVMDADQIAREVVAPGSPALADLRSAFGDSILQTNGALDRAALARVVFGDAEKRAQLNAITHPRIAARSLLLQDELRAQGIALACYDAALLIENGLAAAFRPLVVVVAPRALQLARIQARDGLELAAANARIDAQMPAAEKAKFADYLLRNEGSLTDLAHNAAAVLAQIRTTLAGASAL